MVCGTAPVVWIMPDLELEPEYSFKDFAKANTTESLDPEHPMNTYMRDNGIGLLPNLFQIDPSDLSATMACGSIMCNVTIPLGWFIFDDGRRVLIYDQDNHVQVNLNVRSGPGLQDTDILDNVIAEHLAQTPDATWGTMELGGMKTFAIRCVPVDGELLDQVYLAKATPNPEAWLICRVSCLPDTVVETMNMVEVIMKNIRFIYE